MSLANAEALCDAIRRRWPNAIVAPFQVTGYGDDSPPAVVEEPPRPCNRCGTEVFAIRKPHELAHRWYTLGRHEVKANGWSRIHFEGHNRRRCEAARPREQLIVPGGAR